MFMNEPVCGTPIYWFEIAVEIAFMTDIVLNFRTGYFKDSLDMSQSLEEKIVEYDTSKRTTTPKTSIDKLKNDKLF